MNEIKQAIQKAVSELFKQDVGVVLTRPDPQFGDFACNIAMQLAGKLGASPREIADQIVVALKKTSTITDASVAGPGFINITVSDEALVSLAESTTDNPYKDQTIVIETNNPNPFKAMHIGHAFNAILGDTIANILEAGAAKTYRVSYHGDVGLHVGKSMYSLLGYIDGDISKLDAIAPQDRNCFMSKMYADGARAYKEDEAAKAKIDELTKQSFTRDDATYAAVYDLCLKWSFEDIDANVARLGNTPIEKRFLESDAELRGVKIVKDNVPKVFIESDGALVFKGSEHGSYDNAFVSKRGTGLYASRDLGLVQLKNEQYHPDKSYIVTAEEQRAYFVGVLAAVGLCMPELKDKTVNISTGTVKLTTGKMSSRDGDVVEINWLFEQIGSAITERGGAVSDAIVAGALRYQFLKVKIGSDVIFDISESVSLQGNSGVYLQYAHARACSILRKDRDFKAGTLSLDDKLQPDERRLLRKVGEYTEVVNMATKELAPHSVCTYLYELCQDFNYFYEKNRVIDDSRQALRISLVSAYAQTLKKGLTLLGITALESM